MVISALYKQQKGTSFMEKNNKNMAYMFLIGIFTTFITQASPNKIPAPFRGDTPSSTLTISYDDIDELLSKTVIDTGRSTRTIASKTSKNVGTKFKNNINRKTASEANRFYFEVFKEEKNKEIILNLRNSLASLPQKVALNHFSKKEQLAYWLNLYNITILNELVNIYPQRSLHDLYESDDSILDKKVLNVAGIALSLNDIQHNILDLKYNADPLIIYGLFKGYIGGPNIRTHAYRGNNVYSALADNATEFVNSNRGSFGDSGNFRVSELYAQNQYYFPDFEQDLKQHLLKHIEGHMRSELEQAEEITANIDDWKVADIYGTSRNFGGGINTNSAALLDSVKAPPGLPDPGIGVANMGAFVEDLANKSKVAHPRFSNEQIEMLQKINDKRLLRNGRVTVTDIENTEVDKN